MPSVAAKKKAGRPLKRSAAVAKSAKSPKKEIDETPAGDGEALLVLAPDADALDAAGFLDIVIPSIRTVLMRQLKVNKTTPGKPETAIKRARDASTLASLVGSLERLNTLDTAREKKSRKKPRNDAELRASFERRLDQLLAGAPAADAAAKPEHG